MMSLWLSFIVIALAISLGLVNLVNDFSDALAATVIEATLLLGIPAAGEFSRKPDGFSSLGGCHYELVWEPASSLITKFAISFANLTKMWKNFQNA